MTEGIPLGFAVTAVATRLRRLDVGPAENGVFVASFYLPWVPFNHWSEAFGAAKPNMGTLFTVIFIASALFLLAGRAVLGDAGGRVARVGAWTAPLLILMYARYFLERMAKWLPGGADAASFVAAAQAVMLGIAVLAGVVLLRLGPEGTVASRS